MLYEARNIGLPMLMSPLHHHYQKQGFFETKIVTRFWIVSLLLAAITLVTLKRCV